MSEQFETIKTGKSLLNRVLFIKISELNFLRKLSIARKKVEITRKTVAY